MASRTGKISQMPIDAFYLLLALSAVEPLQEDITSGPWTFHECIAQAQIASRMGIPAFCGRNFIVNGPPVPYLQGR
jgi:hypothetical protein